jgi:hypothetical protein
MTGQFDDTYVKAGRRERVHELIDVQIRRALRRRLDFRLVSIVHSTGGVDSTDRNPLQSMGRYVLPRLEFENIPTDELPQSRAPKPGHIFTNT